MAECVPTTEEMMRKTMSALECSATREAVEERELEGELCPICGWGSGWHPTERDEGVCSDCGKSMKAASLVLDVVEQIEGELFAHEELAGGETPTTRVLRNATERIRAVCPSEPGPEPGRCMACGQFVKGGAVMCGPCGQAEDRKAAGP